MEGCDGIHQRDSCGSGGECTSASRLPSAGPCCSLPWGTQISRGETGPTWGWLYLSLPQGPHFTPGRPPACREAPVHTGNPLLFQSSLENPVAGWGSNIVKYVFPVPLPLSHPEGQALREWIYISLRRLRTAHWLLELCSPIDMSHRGKSHMWVL